MVFGHKWVAEILSLSGVNRPSGPLLYGASPVGTCVEGDDRYDKCAPELRRGDIVLFSYATLHRGLPNTGDAPRPVFYVTVAPPGAVDAINFAEAPGDA